ncbi:MAG: exo-alpha-sialidase [Flavobacteriaceae bacterium]|nr:exo-alpha-sialidase [Flavobacteriaceae bacterium]
MRSKNYNYRLIFLMMNFCFVSLIAQKRQSAFIFPLQNKHVHSSSIIELPNGDLMACWFEGSGERNANDVMIKGARLKKGDVIWSEPFLMADTPGQPDCNPVLFVDKNKKLKLFWIVVQANRWETSILKYRESSNYLKEGAPKWDWQDVILLKPGEEFPETIKSEFSAMESRGLAWAEYALEYETMIYDAAKEKKKRETGWMTRIHPIVLPNGRILLPLYSDGYNLSLVAISDDQGKSWKPSKPIVGYGNIQPSIVQKKDGSLVAYMRDNGDSPGRILISASKDNGESWTAAKESDIPNPGTSIDLIKLKNGNWVMAYNDIEDGRYSIVVSLSDDEGKTWKWTKQLERDDNKKGSFSYPSIIQTKDGKIHVTYSYKTSKVEKSIKYNSFNEKWLKGN